MSLDEDAINTATEYFESFALNAVNIVHESVDSDTTFAEFMEKINIKINQFAAELVASEVLSMTANTIEAFNNGEGLTVDEVQEIIDNGGVADRDEDEDDEGIRF